MNILQFEETVNLFLVISFKVISLCLCITREKKIKYRLYSSTSGLQIHSSGALYCPTPANHLNYQEKNKYND